MSPIHSSMHTPVRNVSRTTEPSPIRGMGSPKIKSGLDVSPKNPYLDKMNYNNKSKLLPQSKKIQKMEIKPVQTTRPLKKPLVDLTNKYKQNKTKDNTPTTYSGLNKSYSKNKPSGENGLIQAGDKSPLREQGHSILPSASPLHRRESTTRKYVRIDKI